MYVCMYTHTDLDTYCKIKKNLECFCNKNFEDLLSVTMTKNNYIHDQNTPLAKPGSVRKLIPLYIAFITDCIISISEYRVTDTKFKGSTISSRIMLEYVQGA